MSKPNREPHGSDYQDDDAGDDEDVCQVERDVTDLERIRDHATVGCGRHEVPEETARKDARTDGDEPRREASQKKRYEYQRQRGIDPRV